MYRRSIAKLGLALFGLGLFVATACSDDPSECSGEDCGGAGTGGKTGTGGKAGTSGVAGKSAGGAAGSGATAGKATTGGSTGTSVGGTSGVGESGGAAPQAGTPAAGGSNPTTGGVPAAAGAPSAGGVPTAGGGTGGTLSGAGGTVNTAGASGSVAVGGTAGVSGSPELGGAAGSGGASESGGTAGVGGVAESGGTTGTGGVSGIEITTGVALVPGWEATATWWGGNAPAATGTYPRIFVSSTQSTTQNTPAMAFDADTTQTMWVSAGDEPNPSGPTPADPEFIGVEFGSVVIINRVSMTPRTHADVERGFGPKVYEIQTSDNGTDWTTQATEVVTDWRATITTVLPAPVNAKLIRLLITDGYDVGPKPVFKVFSPPRNTQVRNLHIE